MMEISCHGSNINQKHIFISLVVLHAGYVDSDEPVQPPYKLITSKYCMLTYLFSKSTYSKQKLLCVPSACQTVSELRSGLEVIKLEFILRLKIKRNDWLLADTCLPAANHCALF